MKKFKMARKIIKIEYRRSLVDGIYKAGFWQDGGLIPEERFIEEFRKNYSCNEHKPEIKIFYGGTSEEEVVEFRKKLEKIISQVI